MTMLRYEVKDNTKAKFIDFRQRFTKALVSAFKSESNRLRQALRTEAQRTTPPITPLTRVLRLRRQQAWPLLSRLMSYWVDETSLTSEIGILTTGPRPVSRGAAVLGMRHAEGYSINVTEAAQDRLAGKLKLKGLEPVDAAQGVYGKIRKSKAKRPRRKPLKVRGKVAIPTRGLHSVVGHQVIRDVWAAERQQVWSNIAAKVHEKLRSST